MKKAVNIQWDYDDEDEAEVCDSLPDEIEIPPEIEDDEDAISDYISDVTGWCHNGFAIEGESSTNEVMD